MTRMTNESNYYYTVAVNTSMLVLALVRVLSSTGR